jgi:hypothetical protein
VVKQARQLGMMSYEVEDIEEFIRETPGIFSMDPRKRAEEETWVYANVTRFPLWLKELDKLPMRLLKDTDGKKINTYETVIDFDDMVRLPCIFSLAERFFTGKDTVLVDECLPYGIPVLLADGTSLPIGKIVEEKLPIEVRCFDTTTGTQHARRVTGWHKILNQKPLVKIRARWKKRKGTNRPTNFVVCTSDHKIWCKMPGEAEWSWKEAGALVQGATVQVETEATKTSQ